MAGGAPIRISILANSRQARQEIASFSSTLKRALGTGAALAGAYGGVQLLKDVANAGSEAQQTLGGTQAVFKKYAGQVDAYSRKAAKSVGLSANEYRSSATLIGSLLKGQGVALDKLGGKTNNLIGIASDLAATYGGTTKDAVESLTSAFKGEFDPIEKYGISLKQSTVNAEAVAIAQKQHGRALKDLSVEQQTAIKQQATYRLIMAKSADAQGQFARESDTLAGKQARLSAELENTKAKIGTSLLPVLTDAADFAAREVVPALNQFSDWFSDNVDEIAASGREIGSTFLPPLEATADVAKLAAKALGSIPPPVRELAVELLIAAKAFNVLEAAGAAAGGGVMNAIRPITDYRAAVAAAAADVRSSTWQGALTQKAYDDQVRKSAQTLRSQLAPALSSVAGMGGMGLLLTSTQQNDRALGGLMKVAGGAATGFSVGGPLGAAIGGLAGLLWGARDAYNATEGATRRAAAEAAKTQAWQTAKDAALELREALYGTRDAYNEVTAASVKKGLFAGGKKAGWVQDLEKAGVNLDTITRAILGQRDAQNLVNQAFAKQDAALASQRDKIAGIKAELKTLGQVDLASADEATVIREAELREELKQLTLAYDENRTAVESRDQSYGKLSGTTERQTALERSLREQLGLTKKQYDSMPEVIRTRIEANGPPQIKSSLMDLLSLTNDLNGKQVVSFVKASGAKLAETEVAALQKRFKLTPKQVATLLKVTGTNKAKNDAAKGGRDAGDAFGRNTAAGVRGRGGDVREAARVSVERARAAAAREAAAADNVGRQLAAGFERGIGAGASAVASAAASVVRRAIAEARKEAEIRSPSRKTTKDGKHIADGYAKGIRKGWPDVKRAISTGMRSLFDRQVSPSTQFLADLRSQIRSSFNGKAEKRALSVVATYERRVRKTYESWARVSAQIEQGRARLEEMRQEADAFRSSTSSAVRGWFDPFAEALSQAAAFTDKGGLLGAVLGNAKAQAGEISQTTNLLNEALKRGLSKDAYERILALSPQEANKIAVSLATATSGQINELNGYYATVNKSAKSASDQAYASFFKVGITAQQALVDGLLKDKAAIERAADRLAREIEAATNRRLKGKGKGAKKSTPKKAKATTVTTGTARGVFAQTVVAAAPASAPVIHVTVNAPVGASPYDIGRELNSYLKAYASIGGGR